MGKETVHDTITSLCGALSDLGCQYDFKLDNRGVNRSGYVYVRKPIAAKIRVSDHASDRLDKDKGRMKVLVIDVGIGGHKHGITWQEAVAQITTSKLTENGRG